MEAVVTWGDQAGQCCDPGRMHQPRECSSLLAVGVREGFTKKCRLGLNLEEYVKFSRKERHKRGF